MLVHNWFFKIDATLKWEPADIKKHLYLKKIFKASVKFLSMASQEQLAQEHLWNISEGFRVETDAKSLQLSLQLNVL